jgi:hypothetical protein
MIVGPASLTKSRGSEKQGSGAESSEDGRLNVAGSHQSYVYELTLRVGALVGIRVS